MIKCWSCGKSDHSSLSEYPMFCRCGWNMSQGHPYLWDLFSIELNQETEKEFFE